jgi:hypothetical protein
MFDESTKEKLIILSIVGCVLIGLYFLVDHWLFNPIDIARDGRIASGPVQTPISDAVPITYRGLILTPVARYDIEGRLLSKSHYYFANGVTFSRYDYALGWKRMSDPEIYSKMRIGQIARFYYYSWGSEGPPIPTDEINRSSSNNHLIAIDREIERKIGGIREGKIVRIQGYLVNVSTPDGSWTWGTSTSREDSGAGACETILVKEIDSL